MDAVDSVLPQVPCSPAHKRDGDSVRHLAMKIFGVIQVIIGVVAIVISAVWIHKYHNSKFYARYGDGFILSVLLSHQGDVIWKASVFLISGIIGFAAGYRKTKMLIISSLICCICSFQLIPWTVLTHLGLAIGSNSPTCDEEFEKNRNTQCAFFKSIVPIDALIVALFLVEVVCSMSGSALCLYLMTSKIPKEKKPIPLEPDGGYCTISEQADRRYVATYTRVRHEEANTSQTIE